MCNHNCGIDHSTEEIPNNSLYSNINISDSKCLNESNENPLKNCIKPYNQRHNNKYLESDLDPELLIRLVFTNPVDINGIKILTQGGFCPDKISFFKENYLTFDDIETRKPFHTITPNNNILKDIIYPLPTYKFTGIEILYIYIGDNLGEETTRIHYLDLNGKLNPYGKNKGVVNCIYEAKPQIKDHKINNDSKGNIII